jgi:hypothetical protein
MFGLILAAAITASSAEQWRVLHAELLAPAQQCMAVSASPSDACLDAAHKQCVARLMRVGRTQSSDGVLESMCANVENEAWEAVRLDAESKLETAISKWKETDLLASARAAREAWESYRDKWCEDESNTVPTAFTGQAELARAACRKELTQDRLAHVRRMIDWLNP